MTELRTLNFPTQEKMGKEKRNFEYLLLYMLYNNSYCIWNDFLDEPIKIKPSTLSTNLNKLLNNSYIEKIDKSISGKNVKIYQITEIGKKRYEQIFLEKESKEHTVNYPADKYLSLKDIEINLLYMLHNNDYCKWNDFFKGPFHVTDSTLSKKLKYFINKELVKKEKVEGLKYEVYKITEKGTQEYIFRLNTYNLDRQSVLEEESKRIEDIVKNSKTLLKNLNITNNDIKYRFLNNILTINFSKVQGISCSEEEFKKILFFISLNHPDEYPNYISPEEFSRKYSIEINTLNYFLQEIIEKNQFSVKFFKLIVNNNKEYYFSVNEEIEKRLRAIVEAVIKKFTFLKLESQESNRKEEPINSNEIIDNILNKICENLFNKSMRESLENFLPSYIEYLKFIIEKKEKSKEVKDKLKQVAFKEIPKEFVKKADKYKAKKEFKATLEKPIEKSLKVPIIDKIKKKKEYLESALQDIDYAIKIKPDKIKYYHYKVDLLLELKNYEKALDAIERAIILENLFNLDIKHDISYNYKAEILIKLNKYELALDSINKALEISDWSGYYQTKAEILNSLENYKDALESINKAIEKSPDWWGNYYDQAEIYYNLEDYEESIKAIDQAIHFKPDYDYLYFMKGMYLDDSFRYKEALIAYNKALELKPNDFDYIINIIDILKKLKKYKEAIELVDAEIKKDPKMGDLYEEKARILIKQKNFEKALEITNEAIEILPEKTYLYKTKADILSKIKKYVEAIEILDSAQKKNPDFFYFIKKLEILDHMKNYEEILKLSNNASQNEKIESNKVKLLKIITYALAKLGRYKEAIELIEKLIVSNPNEAELYFMKADMYLDIKEYDIALSSIKIALNLDPKNDIFLYFNGKILYKIEEYSKAIEKLQEAITHSFHSTSKPKYYFYIGKCYVKIGDKNSALEYLKKAKNLANHYDSEELIVKSKKYISEINKELKLD